MSRLALIALAAAAALGLSACSGGEPDTTPPAAQPTEAPEPEDQETGGADDEGDVDDIDQTITVTAEEMAFGGIPETLPAGTIEVEFENIGNAPHDLVVEELDDEQVIPQSEPGQTESGIVTLEPGTYTFYCSVANHREQGMENTVTVE